MISARLPSSHGHRGTLAAPSPNMLLRTTQGLSVKSDGTESRM
mgnify:CR=1 FL=1